MRIAHLIMTYTCPMLTLRMIKAMAHTHFDFYIHVDKKVCIKSYLFLAGLPNVFLIKNREEVRWAGYNTLLATFNSIKEICSTGVQYAYINFLSGQDYPLQSANHIYQFFSDNKGKQFIAYKDYANEWTEGNKRIEKYSLVNYRFKGRYFVEKVVNALLPSRKLPENYHPYGDSMFWMLTPECAMYVVNKVMKDKKFNRYFRFTWGGDEFVFQTMILNSYYKEHAVNNNYRYIDWSAGGSHPKVFEVEDFDKLMNSGTLFGRKFKTDANDKLLDLIDEVIINE